MHELHDRSVAEKRRADIAAQEVEQLQLALDVFRRQSLEIQAVISRLDIRESAEAWDLGAHVIALLDGPVPPGPPPRFCPSCQIADVEDYGLPIPHTDDSAPCARCRRCGHNWALDPAADGCCVACGGSGHLGRQDLDDLPCPCREDHTPQEVPATPERRWIGTYPGRHDSTQVTVTTTRDDTRPERDVWTCTQPTLLDWLRQRAARLRRPR